MSDSPEEKPVVRWTSTVDIESETHGSVRLRKWAVRDSTGIRRLCNEELEPREFVERLLSQQAVEPLLPQEELKDWTDKELTAVAVKWWQAVEGRRTSPIAVDSLAGLQTAVRQRNDEHTESLTSFSAGMSSLNLRMPELNSMERLARDLAKQNALLDFGGQSAIQKMIQRTDFAHPYSMIMDKLQAINLSNPDRLAFASRQERIREARLLSMPTASELSRLAAESSPLFGLGRQTEELARQMNERFRGFESILDSNRIRDVLRSLDSSAYSRFLPDFKALESVASGFRTAWIDRITPETSIMGIARMTALTAAASATNPFDLSSVTTLRAALGDWRDVTMPWRFLPDTNLREQFYIERGFDTSLIQLPEPAFTRALENVGLVRHPMAPSDVDVEEVDEEELLRQRMSQVYKLLFRFERALRDYIDRMMTHNCGTDWERHRCHGNGKIYQLWIQKRDKAIQSGVKPERLIQYADFTEYADLITRTDNWDEVFKNVFGRQESVRESFFRLAPVRLCTMHARPITKTELMLATAEITRLLIAIGEAEEEDK
jgi:hypothetical protein